MFRLVILSLLLLVACTSNTAYGFGGINLLGQSADGADSTVTANVSGLSNSTESAISSINSINGSRNVDFQVYNRQGCNYVRPDAMNQIFPGCSTQKCGNNWVVSRSGGGTLTFLIELQKLFLLFLGQKISTNINAYEENGNTFLPLNTMGEFFNTSFQQNGSSLQAASSATPQWLSDSWQQTLNQSGATSYANDVSQAAASGNQTVFRDITATVFSSEETNQKGAYGEWLRRDDLFVALPKRFSGTRPRVAVQGPNGTYEAEIKDVGPWNINDPYWETGARPQAESGYDMGQTRSGRRRTNLAGIDLSFRLGELVGVQGKGKVNWWFVE